MIEKKKMSILLVESVLKKKWAQHVLIQLLNPIEFHSMTLRMFVSHLLVNIENTEKCQLVD